MNMFLSTWTLLVAGLIFALPMIHLRVKNHTELADETLFVYATYFAVFLLTHISSLRMDDSGHIKEAVHDREPRDSLGVN